MWAVLLTASVKCLQKVHTVSFLTSCCEVVDVPNLWGPTWSARSNLNQINLNMIVAWIQSHALWLRVIQGVAFSWVHADGFVPCVCIFISVCVHFILVCCVLMLLHLAAGAGAAACASSILSVCMCELGSCEGHG
jgi:hypothetical protein